MVRASVSREAGHGTSRLRCGRDAHRQQPRVPATIALARGILMTGASGRRQWHQRVRWVIAGEGNRGDGELGLAEELAATGRALMSRPRGDGAR